MRFPGPMIAFVRRPAMVPTTPTERDAIDRQNLNKPQSELVCPHCKAQDAKRDREWNEHPGGVYVWAVQA